MTPFAFDTLSASKQLREAGMPEGVAEAVVAVFQHASAMPDISHLATKADVADMATKSDLELLSVTTRTDIQALRSDIADMARRAELDQLRADIRADFASFRAEIGDKMRQQTWALLGGIATLVTILNVTLKVSG